MGKANPAAAVPFFRRAIGLDPNFAMAYALLGLNCAYLGQTSLAAENTRKAYELRERVSQREKFFIESNYYFIGLGQYDKALEKTREALQLDRGNGANYASLVGCFLLLSRLDDARATAQQAQAKNLDSTWLRMNPYTLAFLQNDAAAMAQQVAWAAGKSGVEDWLMTNEADTVAYSGRLMKAREFSSRAVASAKHAGNNETAAGYEADAALREALFGNATEARQQVTSAFGLSTGRDAQYRAALAN